MRKFLFVAMAGAILLGAGFVIGADNPAEKSAAKPPEQAPKAETKIYEETFDATNATGWVVVTGDWKVENGAYMQSDLDQHAARACLSKVKECKDYRLELDATQNEGAEGFLVFFKTQNKYCMWVLGGWANTTSIAQGLTNAEETRTDDVIESKRKYHIQIEVRPDKLTAWLDGKQKWSVGCSAEQVEGLSPDDPERGEGMVGLVGLGTWLTSASFDNVKITELAPAAAGK